ncbi:MAG: hypothetical protein CM1200mP20_12220 [Pseudomonadota bacterium]|nr:MAG: hypothetical protein CM1200mP20_12220 [Pseudomonadota bacterium]
MMPFDYQHLISLRSTGHPRRYSDRDTMLYALSIGMGRDPLAGTELDYVFERNPLKTETNHGFPSWHEFRCLRTGL